MLSKGFGGFHTKNNGDARRSFEWIGTALGWLNL